MSAYSSNNIDLLQQPYHAIKNLHLNLFRLEVKATATVNQASFDYPILEITTDNDATMDGVREGEYFRVFDGSGNIVLHGIHRRNFDIDTHTMYIARMVDGQDWFSREIALSLDDDYTIESYTVMIPGAFLSRFDSGSSPLQIYKRGDRELDLTNPQTAFPKPQPNVGSAQQADVISTVATFTHSAVNSRSFIGGNLSYLWDVGTGTITVGTATDDTITWEVPAGQHYIECRVEDDAIPVGSSQTAKRGFRPVFANGATYKSFSDQYQVTLNPISIDTSGARFQFTVYGQEGIDELYTGAPVLLSFDIMTSADAKTWDELEDGVGRINICGYVGNYSRVYRDTRGVKYVTVDVISPMQYAESLPFANQSLKAVSGTPADWQETTEALMNAEFWQYYGIEYHAPPFGYLHDYDGTDVTAFQRPGVGLIGGNVAAALRQTATLYTGVATCTRDGSIYAKRDPCLEDDTYRDAVPVVWTWEDNNIEDDTYFNASATPGVDYQLLTLLKVGDMSGAGSVSSATDVEVYEVRYALDAQGQSPNHGSIPQFIGFSQADIQARIGHAYQRENARFDLFTIPARANLVLTAEPALMEWHKLDYPTYDPFVTGMLDDKRVLPVSVSVEIDAENLAVLGGSIQVRPETKGKPGDVIVREVSTGDGIIPPNVWSYFYDFTTSNQGFAQFGMPDRPVVFGAPNRGTWVTAQGWTTESYSNSGVKHMCEVSKALPSPAYVTSVQMVFANDTGALSGGGTSLAAYAVAFNGGTMYKSARYGGTFGGSPAVLTIGAVVDTVAVALYFQLTSTQEFWATGMLITGTGINPFI